MATTASLQPQAGRARTFGPASTSGRHAAPPASLQPAIASLSGGGAGGRQQRSLAARAQSVGSPATRGVPSRGLLRRAGTTPPPPGLQQAASPLMPQQTPQQLQQQQQQAAARRRIPAAQMLEVMQQRYAAQAAAVAEPQPPGEPATDKAGNALDETEVKRRQKISAANKGRTPWNKGLKHSPETIARIKARTREAMQRADVRERLQKANEQREPHTDAAKAKIRAKLRERADRAREEITQQAAAVVERLRRSDDPALRECAEYERAEEVVAGLAWQYFKKEWQDVSTRGWDLHPEFRPRCIAKLRMLLDRQRLSAAPKKRKVDKVRAAMGQLKKLAAAQEKLAVAEEAMGKLQRAKTAFAAVGDPAKRALFAEAEAKAAATLTKLRKQAAKLEAALQPLQEYLDSDLVGELMAADAAPQQQVALEQRLEAQAQAHAAAAEETAAADAQHSQLLHAQPQDSGSPQLNGHANGSVPLAGSAATPARTSMPWH